MTFKYKKEDFGELQAKLKHMALNIKFYEDRVDVTNVLEMEALKDFDELILDADELKINSIKSNGKSIEYDYKKSKLRLKMPAKEGDFLVIETNTTCQPSDTDLEGIYKDSTMPGKPQQYMSQCQQWGFQRIAPVIDDCRAKCTFTTTLEGDEKYTHLISNGNIIEGPKVENGRKTITFENKVPMAPYLFLAIAGTWDVLGDEVAYDNGKVVKLEYLVPEGRTEDVRTPMEILKKSILWIKKEQDYEYPFDTYRTITMDRSFFGGMENVGNTTIVTDAALIDEHTLDMGLIYAHAVIVHEFEHNQCGSETTMETPFDMWLNEAYTVNVERNFVASQFDPAYVRLNQVRSIRDPLLGPLSIEDSGKASPIVRNGFNHPNELVDALTYVKAAEVIRMLKMIMGQEKFKKAKTEYFQKYHNGNANTDQFFECFEEVHGESLQQFKKHWLLKSGYPHVKAKTSYNDGKFTIEFKQKGEFHFPLKFALVSEDGKDLYEETIELKEKQKIVVIETDKPAFASLNRNYSFYGTFEHTNATEDEIILQAKKDPNTFSRVEAMKILTDKERVKLLENPDSIISESWISLWGEILKDNTLSTSVKAEMLIVTEAPLNRKYATWYLELYNARKKLIWALIEKYPDEIYSQFQAVDTYKEAPLEEGIQKRMLKAVLQAFISEMDDERAHKTILNHFKKATTANDKVTALISINRSSMKERKVVLEDTYKKWNGHLSGYSNYLRAISVPEDERVFDDIEKEQKREGFDIKQPTHTRALIMPMVFNTKIIWSEKGIKWVGDKIIEYADVNTTLASRLLNTFQHVDKLKDYLKIPVNEQLKRISESTSNPTVNGQAKKYLNQ